MRVIAHDAVEVLAQQLPPASLDEVLIYFPDPWPKKRHHKRRIVQPAFAAFVADRLKPGGTFHLATDWEPYALHMLDVLNAEPQLVNAAADGRWTEDPAARDRHASSGVGGGSDTTYSTSNIGARDPQRPEPRTAGVLRFATQNRVHIGRHFRLLFQAG